MWLAWRKAIKATRCIRVEVVATTALATNGQRSSCHSSKSGHDVSTVEVGSAPQIAPGSSSYASQLKTQPQSLTKQMARVWEKRQIDLCVSVCSPSPAQ